MQNVQHVGLVNVEIKRIPSTVHAYKEIASIKFLEDKKSSSEELFQSQICIC